MNENEGGKTVVTCFGVMNIAAFYFFINRGECNTIFFEAVYHHAVGIAKGHAAGCNKHPYYNYQDNYQGRSHKYSSHKIKTVPNKKLRNGFDFRCQETDNLFFRWNISTVVLTRRRLLRAITTLLRL